MNVLIVDDSPTFRDRLKRLLLDAPALRVIGEAGDGHSALHEVDALRPDTVILDIQMPGADGFVVLREVKQRFGATAVIVLTSDASTGVRMRCAALGANAVIDKSDAATDVLPALQQLSARPL